MKGYFMRKGKEITFSLFIFAFFAMLFLQRFFLHMKSNNFKTDLLDLFRVRVNCRVMALHTPQSSRTRVLPLFLGFFLAGVPDISKMLRVFINGPGRVIPKTQKMVLDASLLNTQHYKVWIKGKVEQSRERSSALPYTLV